VRFPALGVAARHAVARMQHGNPFGRDEAGMRTDKARVKSGIDEGPPNRRTRAPSRTRAGKSSTTRHLPVEGEQPWQVQAGPAAEVEAPPRAHSEQAVDDFARGQSELRKVLVVPLASPS
jgi:hypothetical protein